MSLNLYLTDVDGAAARDAYQARVRAAALERLVREGQPTLRERAAGLLVALAFRLAPSLRGSVAGPARPAASAG